ncbi:penicillin-binding protein 2 [Rhodobaculum claviforme]|uniref:Penicillin-binding protein 2 n=1 Tax=Rhodobaculum claviforme TaxID=1549854 RepID=A0A934TK33_9RHOB|nr:penicillin-binding protein 2 [Rhodobaculum claviforme]MBK5927220.1 penicillin-binding protein 2 [Rhodobaculum claviforme]
MKRTTRDTAEGARRVTRRALLLGSMMGAGMLMLAGRMRQIQVAEADQFRLLAEENRINIRLIPPVRGLIHDRTGAVVAGNEQNYRVVIVREDAGDVEEVLGRLARLIELPDEVVERTLREVRRHRPFVPVTIAERLSWDQIARIAANAPALPGVTPEVGLSRHYPLAGGLAHVVGYVGAVSERDIAEQEVPDPVLQLPGFQIGRIGVERHMEHALRGSAGTRRIEVNAVGRVMRELDRREGTAGRNVQLTIDHRLQAFVQARVAGESAAVIVMDVRSGDLLSIASSPSYDPNLFAHGISVPDFRALLDDPYRPLVDKTVQGVYPPGSTFKMAVALAALEAGVTVPEERVFCPGHVDISGRRFHCWKRGGHGRVGLVSAISESCDVYFYEMGQRLGIERINAMSERLGMGVRHALPMSSVAAGLNPTREWKRDRRGEAWQVGDTINASIGQGFVLSSPLQLAVMTARLATGRAVAPRLVRAIGGREEPPAETPALGLDARALAVVRQGMSEVVNHRRGTAWSSRVVESSARLAGKTGTSQVFSITAAERAAGVRRQQDLPWNRRNHALFVGYGPEEAPAYAVVVVIEHGGGGSSAAAPVARDVYLQALHGGFPPLAAYPEPQRNRIETMQQDLSGRMAPGTVGGRDRA